MVIAAPFSYLFWICYISGGLSDLMDGIVARKLCQQSQAGAKLDSIADMAFAIAVLITGALYISIPAWLLICVSIAAFIRLASYGIGFYKYRTFAALHTYANKATGALVFAFPLLYAACGLTAAGILLCFAAVVSSLEELVITLKSPKLDRECKSLLSKDIYH